MLFKNSSTLTLKSSPNGPKMVPKWSQNGAKISLKLYQKCSLAIAWSKVAPGCRSWGEDEAKIGIDWRCSANLVPGPSWQPDVPTQSQVGADMCHTCPQDGQFERIGVGFWMISEVPELWKSLKPGPGASKKRVSSSPGRCFGRKYVPP